MILIIGYGNPLRGDDALGQVAAAHLARHFRDDDDIHVRNVQQLTPELSQTIATYETVLLIDARHETPPGRLLIAEVQPGAAAASHPFSHYVTPADLLALAHGLYAASPRMLLVGITADSFAVGAPLSPPVQAALPRLYDEVIRLVNRSR